MGSGRWSATTYDDRAAAKAAAGKDTFDYSVAALRSGHLRVHQTLDPMGLIARERSAEKTRGAGSAQEPDRRAAFLRRTECRGNCRGPQDFAQNGNA